ncbi:MAG: hypothetical protein PHI75_01725 [Bacilli bacterium]|nr:hypothetical protein [Bacilli bacterium]
MNIKLVKLSIQKESKWKDIGLISSPHALFGPFKQRFYERD